MTPHTRLFLTCLLVLALGASANAKDYEEEGRVRDAQALIEKLEKLAEGKDRAKLQAALKEVPTLHNALKTKAVMGKLQKAVGAVLADKEQNVVVRKTAAETLGAMYDEKGVWGQLKSHVPSPKEETIGQIGVAVLKALANVQAKGAIGPLEKLAARSKDANAARLAIAALGQYSYSKKRVDILKFLIGELTRLRPGNTRGPRGRENQQRFIMVRDALVLALNRLTRRNEEGVEPWLELYKANKKTPEKLFRTQR